LAPQSRRAWLIDSGAAGAAGKHCDQPCVDASIQSLWEAKTMKTLLVSSWLLGCLVLLPSAQAAEKATLTVEAFIKGCADAAAGREQVLFTALKPLSVEHRPPVKLFKLRPHESVDINILAMVEKGPDIDIEVPRVTTVCINDVEQPDMFGGKIQFSSRPGDTILVRFHLEGLQHTTWKPKANDCIWMSDQLNKYPDASSWPKCIGGIKHKKVGGGGAMQEIIFNMCSNPNVAKDLSYTYELILVQTSSDGAQVDVGIDPQIINHPH
jgi:hypothetical protein